MFTTPSVNWDRLLDKKVLNLQVVTLNETILNIFQYIQNGRFESDLVFMESLIVELNDLISYTKDLHYENLAKKKK